MLGIILCDDDHFMLAHSKKLAEDCIRIYHLDAFVTCVSSNYKDILNYLKNNPGIYLYFLDLDFGKEQLNGVDIARLIKTQEPMSKIVFVTSHADMGISILKSGVEAFGFVEKSMDIKKMRSEFKRYIELATQNNPVEKSTDQETAIQLPVGIDEYVSFPLSQILYVESSKTVSHFVCYHTWDGSQISVRDTIENTLKTLGSGFMKSHRSVIINKKHVVAVSDGLVRFSNGETTVCSFRLKNEVLKKCLKGDG